jgi:hypothetical protein
MDIDTSGIPCLVLVLLYNADAISFVLTFISTTLEIIVLLTFSFITGLLTADGDAPTAAECNCLWTSVFLSLSNFTLVFTLGAFKAADFASFLSLILFVSALIFF